MADSPCGFANLGFGPEHGIHIPGGLPGIKNQNHAGPAMDADFARDATRGAFGIQGDQCLEDCGLWKICRPPTSKIEVRMLVDKPVPERVTSL